MISRIDKYWLILGVTALMMIGVPWWLLSHQPEQIPNTPPLYVTKIKPQEIVAVDVLTQKPIFNAERAPLAFMEEQQAQADMAAEVPEETAPEAAPAPTLVGLVSKRRGKSVAIVKSGDGETKTMSPGQAIDGWRLVSVGKSGARFASAGTQINVSLDFSNKAIGGPAAEPTPKDVEILENPNE